ncbi:MAG TPA: hypothetical protein VFU47_12210, partial [Armatimonadota bacterium]|nr:hypothetical protein [Armatimonadota bacterium]
MLAAFVSAFLAGLVLALLAGWGLIPALRKLKARQFISSDAPQRHQAKAGTPTMGGAIILAGGLLAALLLPLPPIAEIGGDRQPAYAVLLCTLGFGLVGFLDDLLIIVRGRNLGLRAREKLLGQFVVAIAFTAWFWLSGGWLQQSSLAPLLAVYCVLLMVGMSNAVNLTDGLDGLAAGVSLPVWLVLAVLGGTGAGFAGQVPAYPHTAVF